MGFGQAVQSVLGQYAGFSGRARRAEYWWFTLFAVLVTVVAVVIDMVLGTYPAVYAIAVLALLLPSLAVTVRRLHDTDRSGWWLLIALVPLVGGITLLVFDLIEGTPGPNRFGPSPKHPEVPGGYGAPYGAAPFGA